MTDWQGTVELSPIGMKCSNMELSRWLSRMFSLATLVAQVGPEDQLGCPYRSQISYMLDILSQTWNTMNNKICSVI
jgi:hypothetical protein